MQDADPVVRDPSLVLDALWRKAQAGDVHAARELREWTRREGDELRGDDPWRELTREQRDELLVLLTGPTHPPER
jgi:hypothetical protein